MRMRPKLGIELRGRRGERRRLSQKPVLANGHAGRTFNVMLLNSLKFMGGGETWMLGMAGHLAARGHRTLITARPGTVMLDHARTLGLAVQPLRIAGDLNPILLTRLALLLRRHRVDIVIANISRDVRIAGLVKKFSGGSAVIALHQIDRPISNRWNYRFTFNALADAVVVNSESTRRTVLASNPWMKDERMHVIPHGIPPIDSEAASRGKQLRIELGLTADDLVIGFVGRLSGQKGISTLLAAMAIIEQEHPKIHLVIAGTGTLEAKVKRFAASRPNVHVLGFRDDVPGVMSACDVLLVPSLWEGFGLVVVEAMAAGIPCIASDISSLPEILETESNGLLVPADDPAALARAVVRLAGDPNLRERFRVAGLATVSEKFTVERMISTYEKLFTRLRPAP